MNKNHILIGGKQMNIKICDFCGVTEKDITISPHKVTGCINNNYQVKIVNVCLCCESWGVMDFEDKVLEITEFDEICWKE